MVKNRTSSLSSHSQLLAMIGILITLWVVFSLLTDGNFLAPRNLSNLFRQMAVISFLSVGMVLVIVSGNIDLSVGSICGFTGGIAAMIQVKWLGPVLLEYGSQWDPFWIDLCLSLAAIAAALLCGTLIGLFHGFWVAYGGVPSFIVTLAGLLIFRGALLGVTRGATVAPMEPTFRSLGQSYLPGQAGWWLAAAAGLAVWAGTYRRRLLSRRHGFEPISIKAYGFLLGLALAGLALFTAIMNLYRGIPLPLLLLTLLALGVYFLARHTCFGRHLYAIGGNREAARLSGIHIKKRILTTFALMGFLAAVSGIVLTARLDAATTGAGEMFELSAIAACVIGGTSLMGGKGSVLGALLGGLIMGSLDNGMSLMNVEIYWQQVIKGLVLLLAVYGDLVMRGRSR